jgi:hypothetical protein
VSSYDDKVSSIKYTPSEKIYGTYHGTLSKNELVLLTQIQNYEMYGPQTLVYADRLNLDLQPGLDYYHSALAGSVWSAVQADEENASYAVTYDYETDVYRVTKE